MKKYILKLPTVKSINNVIDSSILDVLLKGVSEATTQNIHFLPIIPLDDKNITSYADGRKNYCNNNNEICSLTKKLEEKQHVNSKSILYLCGNVNKTLHLKYPLIVDGKIIGYFVSGKGVFINKQVNVIDAVIKIVNRDIGKSLKAFLDIYKVRWYDKEYPTGVLLTDKILNAKIDSFKFNVSKINELLDYEYVGRVRGINRKVISELFKLLYPEKQEHNPRFGKSAFENNFTNALDFLYRDVLPIRGILFYDNIITHQSYNILKLSIRSGDNADTSNSTEELLFHANLFSEHFSANKIIYASRDTSGINLRIYNSLSQQLHTNCRTLIILPFNIDVNNGIKAALILLSDEIEITSVNLHHFLLRVYDILKYAVQIYYDQMSQERYLRKTSHELKRETGEVYVVSEDILSNYNNYYDNKDKLKNNISRLHKLAKKLLPFSNLLTTIGQRKYTDLWTFNIEEIDIYSEIIAPILSNYYKQYKLKNIIVKRNIASTKKIYVNRGNVTRVFENIIVNILKYTLPSTKVELKIFEKSDEFIYIQFTNITCYINMSERETIFNEDYRANNTIIFDRINKDYHLKLHSEGLGLKIARDLIEFNKGRIHVDITSPNGHEFNPAIFDTYNLTPASIKNFVMTVKLPINRKAENENDTNS